jgi:hypothetical protein
MKTTESKSVEQTNPKLILLMCPLRCSSHVIQEIDEDGGGYACAGMEPIALLLSSEAQRRQGAILGASKKS